MERLRNAGTALPDFAEFIIGRRYAPTRWLHPGYGHAHSPLRKMNNFNILSLNRRSAPLDPWRAFKLAHFGV
jgi:hypothetical protein